MGLFGGFLGNVQGVVVEHHVAIHASQTGALCVQFLTLSFYSFFSVPATILMQQTRHAHVLQNIVTGHHQAKQRLGIAHVAVPLALQDATELLPPKVSEDALLAESVAAEVTANEVASFSAPPAGVPRGRETV